MEHEELNKSLDSKKLSIPNSIHSRLYEAKHICIMFILAN